MKLPLYHRAATVLFFNTEPSKANSNDSCGTQPPKLYTTAHTLQHPSASILASTKDCNKKQINVSVLSVTQCNML